MLAACSWACLSQALVGTFDAMVKLAVDGFVEMFGMGKA